MEFLDVCDENGIPTGEIVERQVAHKDGINHRTAHVWVVRIFNGEPQVLLQKRAMNKDSFPGKFDTSSAGHIQAGDEPLESAIRELEEELGIKASGHELEHIGKFHIEFDKVFNGRMFKDRETAYVYVYRKNVDIEKLVLQEEEITKVQWFDVRKLDELLKNRDDRFCVPRKGFELVKGWINDMRDEKIIIRLAVAKDIPCIGKLLYQVHKVHSDLRPDLFKKGAKKYNDDEIKQIIANEKTPVFVADIDGKVVGYAFCIQKQFVNNNNMTGVLTLYIDDLCVDENMRGHHIGTKLYEYVVNYAKNNGFYNITLNVWADNKEAVRFYEKIGLRIQKIGMEKIL